MKRFAIYILVIYGLFYFSEGKPCPEKTRPHKTRCEAYYKCRELPNKTHVWVPEKCEQGLIYEQNLKMCVLPGDDWECLLGDIQLHSKKKINDGNEVSHIVNTDKHEEEMNKNKEADIYIISNNSADDDENDLIINQKASDNRMEVIFDTSLSREEENDDENESSGDGALIELDGFLQAENREETQHKDKSKPEKKESIESTTTLATSKIDPNLTAHLQRLSQLIDGLKQTYQSTNQEQQLELRPDQLNAFLAHFNIKNKFDSITPTAASVTNYQELGITSTTAAPAALPPNETLPLVSKNKTLLQNHLSNKMKAETKVVLTSAAPTQYGGTGYSNSQIVVNRPEGSVLFSLPPYNTESHFVEHTAEYGHNTPKISEETLKTVLELSKQMIATQNVPKVIPNPTYYAQPIIQPLYLPASFSGHSHGNPFSSYFNSNNNADYDDNDDRYNKYGSLTGSSPLSTGYNTHGSHKHHKKRPSSGTGYSKVPGTTIIHNNVIPVHVTSTNSGEKEVVDSYGQSLGLYPPLNVAADGNANNNNGYQAQTINHLHHHSHRYEDNKFITSVTTVRPIVTSTASGQYAAQYDSPYSTEISVTTPRPYDYKPTPTNIVNYYTPSPHLNENNVNSLFQSTDRFPTVQYGNLPQPMDLNRPNPSTSTFSSSAYYQPVNQNSLFPAQIDPSKVKIRPNSQKIESMEVEPDELTSNGYDGQAQPNLQLNYNYGSNDKLGINNQLAHSNSYIDQTQLLDLDSSSSGSQHNNPYMPRPQSPILSNFGLSINKPKLPSFSSHPHSGGYSSGETQLVNVGGNFISYDVFQNSILPLMGQSQSLNDVEVITCTAGVRQPNITDCTRYYVCSKKDGKVLSYSCPPYTAFNPQTRICDARTYSVCTPEAIVSSYTVNENKRIQLESLKALQDAKKRREQAMKAQHIASLLQQYNEQLHGPSIEDQVDSNENNVLNSYMQQAAALASVVSTTARPSQTTSVKKRKYYCKEGDKIADKTSIYNYFVCYKNAQGMMRGHKMTCSKGLLFCPKTTMCTLQSKCT